MPDRRLYFGIHSADQFVSSPPTLHLDVSRMFSDTALCSRKLDAVSLPLLFRFLGASTFASTISMSRLSVEGITLVSGGRDSTRGDSDLNEDLGLP